MLFEMAKTSFFKVVRFTKILLFYENLIKDYGNLFVIIV